MEVSSLEDRLWSVRVDDPSQVGEVRRTAVAWAASLGFDDADRGRVALVVTEAATNVVRHGGGGMVLLHTVTDPDGVAIEALFVDRGPGIIDVDRALRDGHSTGGTAGTGLGAITRLADAFDLYSNAGTGTVLVTRIKPRPGSADPGEPAAGTPRPVIELGAVCLPCPGESERGDAWAAADGPWGAALLVADGLGHGPMAAAAAAAAVRVFLAEPHLAPTQLMADLHEALRSTRGATAAIARLDLEQREIRFVGVGNIAASVLSIDGSRSMVSQNGTVGHEIHRIQEFTYPWPADSLVVLHSDGLQSQWRLDRYPEVIARHPSVVAGLLYRDFARGRDDVTVLAAREAGG